MAFKGYQQYNDDDGSSFEFENDDLTPGARLLEDTTYTDVDTTPSTTSLFGFWFLWNETMDTADDFTSKLQPATDVSVDAVVTSLYFNAIVFVLLMTAFEILRRIFPSVYAAKRTFLVQEEVQQAENQMQEQNNSQSSFDSQADGRRLHHRHSLLERFPSLASLPHPNTLILGNKKKRNSALSSSSAPEPTTTPLEQTTTAPSTPYHQHQDPPSQHGLHNDSSCGLPLDWVGPVFGVSWSTVRKTAGLDAYFFLRYIRMCVRITAISAVWAALILVPVYATAGGDAHGWYKLSMSNIPLDLYTTSATEDGNSELIVHSHWRMQVPVVFVYLCSFFCFFVMKQEYTHFMELRMDFLGRSVLNVDPQHHYSLLVENIPLELRSDRALKNYFHHLFPGKVHSASMIRKLPTLEALSARRLRVVRRLEKSIAVVHAKRLKKARVNESGDDDDDEFRPSHRVGEQRMHIQNCIDIKIPHPIHDCCTCRSKRTVVRVDEEGPYPPPGTWVDSISYYTRDLAECNREVHLLQQRQAQPPSFPQDQERQQQEPESYQGNWFTRVVDMAKSAGTTIMEDSTEDNGLRAPRRSVGEMPIIPQAEHMTTSLYGSISPTHLEYQPGAIRRRSSQSPASPTARRKHAFLQQQSSEEGVSDIPSFDSPKWDVSFESTDDGRRTRLIASDYLASRHQSQEFQHPDSRNRYRSTARRIIGRLGLDFVVAGVKYLNRQTAMLVATLYGGSMASTGFVTFLDLTSVTSAASVPLSHKPNVLKVSVAPEPRDIRWQSVHVPKKLTDRRETYAAIFLTLGAILWSIPLTAIQFFATADQVARLPGLQWILSFQEGKFKALINGYLPVVALLALIMVLPVIFEFIAVHYEHRKTHSEVQRSMLQRYFYFQLVNVYVTVSAGSLWNSLADILNHPSHVLQILGRSLPRVAGYFVSLLLTKILAGLPIIFLRVGALGRLLFLRSISSEDKLTQRELDGVYRRENVLFGWEYPSQLLVIVICFTYAVICPVILPFGAIFFIGSLMVYKKQVLYVYTPIYESGGSMFPSVCDCTLFGLVCGQLTLIGYTVIRSCFYEPLWLSPLPLITIWVMRYFRVNYAGPSSRLSMERAKERDRITDVRASKGGPVEAGKGIDDRREKFDKNSYRQPLLSGLAIEPMPYRQGIEDSLTEEAKSALRRHNRYVYTTGQTSFVSNLKDDSSADGLSAINSMIPEEASQSEDGSAMTRSRGSFGLDETASLDRKQPPPIV